MPRNSSARPATGLSQLEGSGERAVTGATAMHSEANLNTGVVRTVDPGMTLYPSGDKMGVCWKVTDELGNAGWVVSTQFQLAR